ncbi:hypothetical protein [Aestuariibaculum suncheonense]|uniref:Calx-beta domain-containing protein n=1 Tax=Aestuariibaculum suncheonense TaxID=1028745 RepID=A0A8J6Q5W1_9FLAO|nr:hypothetical protein [Aestuariibaculum suncheonense]MBD0834310.1 hypothetical protein [Aestuariibaculum suncheonense]
MKKIAHILLMLVTMASLQNCEDTYLPPELNYITLDESSMNIVVNENSSLGTELKIYTSTNMKSDTTVELNITTTMASENYTVPTSVTIPANSNEATIPLTIADNSLSRSGETMSIAFDAPEGYYTGTSKVDLNISVLCPSDLAGSWTYTSGNGKTVTITETGDGTYTVSADNAFTTSYSFNITDSCSNLIVTGGYLEDEFDIPVSGTGTVSEDKNTITLSYTVDGYFTDRSMILTKN